MRFLGEFPPSPAVAISIAARFGILKLRLTTVAGVALVVLAGAGRASATNTGRITVCPSGCDYATIQDAIDAAPRRVIIVIATGTYAGFSLPGTNSALTNVTLLGAGAANTTISGPGAPDGSAVVANVGVSARIRGVTITGSDTYSDVGGSGILNNGTLTLTNSTVSGNSSMFGVGGISNAGTLTVKDSTVSGNDGNGAGGGILNYGTMAVRDSTLSNNTAAEGGAIYNGGPLAVKNSVLSNNAANEGGGIYDVNGEVTLAHSIISGNTPDNCYPPGSVAGCSG